MTKLKTLKEITPILKTGLNGSVVFVDRESVRQEAIKSIKEIALKNIELNKCSVHKCCFCSAIHWDNHNWKIWDIFPELKRDDCGCRTSQILLLKNLFNLTEEDLK